MCNSEHRAAADRRGLRYPSDFYRRRMGTGEGIGLLEKGVGMHPA